MYRDEYPTCEETYATLRIYGDQIDPHELSKRLRLEPSKSQRKGERTGLNALAPVGGWFLSSKGHVKSRDVQRHIVWILDQLVDRELVLRELQEQGLEIDVSCFWASAHGHGGPELSHEIMHRLSSLRLRIGFDVYC